MSGKSVKVWLLGSLTFVSALFTLDAFLWLTTGSNAVLLNSLPLIHFLGAVDPMLYFIGAFATTFILWGLTATVALHNPVESFIGKIVEDSKKENEADVELLEAKTSILEMISDTLNENTKALTSLKDLTFNVRAEVIGLRPLHVEIEKLKDNLSYLNKTIRKVEQNVSKRKLCPTCGKKISEKFRLCPFCGENLLKPPYEAIAAQPLLITEKTK